MNPCTLPSLHQKGLCLAGDEGSRALHATDGSNYRQIPIGVVIPRSMEDIVATVRLCHQYGAPILPRGGGTSLAGQCCNVAVVIDMSKYLDNIIDIDSANKTACVEPGCILDELRQHAERYHLTFGATPRPRRRAMCLVAWSPSG